MSKLIQTHKGALSSCRAGSADRLRFVMVVSVMDSRAIGPISNKMRLTRRDDIVLKLFR
jgi:hypothetical protein